MVYVALVVIVVLALGVGVFALFARSDAKKNNGLSVFARRAILQHGRVGEATILDLANVDTSATPDGLLIYHLCDLVLEVRPAGGAPTYRAPCRQELIASQWMGLRAGAVVPVRIDPNDPQRVLIDVEARKNASHDAQRAELEAHQRRQAELLRGNDAGR